MFQILMLSNPAIDMMQSTKNWLAYNLTIDLNRAGGRCMVSVEHVQGLEEVKSLRIGSSAAPDNIRRKRVTEEEIVKVLDCLGTVAGDMLRIIWYTGINACCTLKSSSGPKSLAGQSL